MERFDDWSTDREVTIEKAREFVGDPELIGKPFLDKYRVATTSGTTGRPGIFLLDERSLAVTNALATRSLGAWLGFSDVLKIVAGGGRTAMVFVPGTHAATSVAAARLRTSPSRRSRIQVFSVHAPLSQTVAQLNAFRPALLAPYASLAKLLAAEQEAGRLNIHPVLVAVTAEGLEPDEYDRIARAFNAKVGNTYAATECMFLSFSWCDHEWLHINSDWVLHEPVDADYQPVPPGEQSHTLLISNLANRVQPILRYDLGDSVLQRPDPCPCGCPLPAIRVRGRSAEVLTFLSERGEVAVPPLAFIALVDRIAGIELFQVVQTAPTTLRVRLKPAEGAEPNRLWQVVHAEIIRMLGAHGLDTVHVELAEEAPEQSPGGKYRKVIPLQ